MGSFIGRKYELDLLNGLLEKLTASMVVLRGRRRIGKSRLIEEFTAPYQTFIFTGIPPTKFTTKESEIAEFVRQLKLKFDVPDVALDSWGNVFWVLAQVLPKERVIVVLDEISWMGSKDHDFPGHIKTAWDLYFKKNDKLMLILCGSVSAWIEENIINNTGFVGRISSTITLEELSLEECNQFFRGHGKNISAYEKFKLLSVTGGIPKYLEEIRPGDSAEQNIKRLCFSKSGFLFSEFDQIFSSIFLRDSEIYFNALNNLMQESMEPSRLAIALHKTINKAKSDYFKELIFAGFLNRDFTWNIKTGGASKLSKLRLSDNYIRFYLKYILPNKSQIESGIFKWKAIADLPGWDVIMGLQFENLVLNNTPKIWEALQINPGEIIWQGPFFQNANTKQKGCQIDYMIQTKSMNLYVCEIKFSSGEIKKDILTEMQNKMACITRPKGFSCRPILIHVNGVSESVRHADYFTKIIDFGLFLSD